MIFPADLAKALSDRYAIERELGAGGMATVYLAQDLRHNRRVALKVMQRGAGISAERFLQEIRTTANLQHPHIVPVFDSGTAADQLFFVMPLIEGESLRGRLDREGALPVAEAVRLVREVAGALGYAHEMGILHRDLKPENILLSRGHALLADFGIARARRDERLTRTGAAMGTPAYMSPEQATGERELGPESDIYALGVILFELLTGKPPFEGPSYESILVKRFTEEAPRLRTLRADAPDTCERAIARALEREPGARFSRAADFATALADQPAVRSAQASIAVLPFANLSPDPDNAYFADGLTEEVTTTLSKIGRLRVISRTTMGRYRGRSDAVAAVARELGVSHALEGSVRKAGERVRISASLIDTAREESLWSERFDGTLADVFDIQDQVATAIVGALEVVLTPEESRRLVERPVTDPEIYDLYLRSRHLMNTLSGEGIGKAVEHLEAALVMAPANPFLLRALGIACFAAVNAGAVGDARTALVSKALRCAEAIERQDRSSPFVDEIRGLIHVAEGRPVEAFVELSRAYDALPEDIDIALWYGMLLIFAGHADLAAAVAKGVMERAPDHALAFGFVSLSQTYLGNFAEALAAADAAPASAAPSAVLFCRVVARLAAGDVAALRSALDQSEALGDAVLAVTCRFAVHAARGDAAAARAQLTPEAEAALWSDLQYAEVIAEGFVILGEIDEAARWLDQAVSLGFAMYEAIVHHNAPWRPLLNDPRLVPILERMRANADRYASHSPAPRALALLR